MNQKYKINKTMQEKLLEFARVGIPLVTSVQVTKDRTNDHGAVTTEDLRRNKSKQTFDQLLKDLLG